VVSTRRIVRRSSGPPGSPGPFSRVPLFDHLGELTGHDLRVDGRRSDAGMTEELLHVGNGRATFEEMRGKRMPQELRRARALLNRAAFRAPPGAAGE